MPFGNQVSDRTLLKEVNKKLMRTGIQTKVTATVQGGQVTLKGTLRYEIQRRTIVRAASQVPGVRQVVDQMTVQQQKRVDWGSSSARPAT